MKKYTFLFLFLLTSCNKDITTQFIIEDMSSCYAISIENNSIELIDVDYEINDYIDVFILYTINQNHLPLGYYVESSSNVELIDSYLDGNDVYYVVDVYIYLTEDIESFENILSLTNKLIGYDETFIIYDNNYLTN